ncbi:MAG TPA: PAS domain S-box protein [Vicinamibacterales bacterium]|nr:PAS domain S-box protein [Vicinamibacterales bacterium]
MELLTHYFASDGFMPHGYCYLWKPGMVWLHVISDSLIALAYLSIPLTLVYFVRKRRDLPFHWMFLCFGAFIVSCGATHAMEVWNLWHADYWLGGAVKVVTALASVATALLLIPLVPVALAIPSPADLRRSEQKFRGLLEAAPDAIVIVNQRGEIALVNAQAERLFGYRREQLLNQPVETVIPPRLRGGHVARRNGFLTDPRVRAMGAGLELFGRRKDGTEFPVEISLSPLETQEGILVSSAIRDITERKQTEEALASVNRRLIEAQEKERARIARELHDHTNQRLSLLAIGLEEVKRELPTQASVLCERLDELRAQTMEALSDLQALSHELHTSKLDYVGLVAAARGFCREFSEQRKLKVNFESHDLPLVVPSDVSLCLFRVLQEALHNAAQHSGAVEFDVALWGTPQEINLRVRDAGAGFDVDAARKGAGLGLVSMQERMQLVKGTLSIESRPQRGSTIHARVPFASSQSEVIG